MALSDMNTLTKVLAGLLAISAFWLWWVIDDYDKLSKDYNTATTQLSQQVEINKDYQARITRLNQLDIKYTRELASAKNEINTLRDAVSSGNKRVYIKAECPTVTKNSTESGSNETTARLNKAVEQDYLRLREMIVENEQQILYLQDYIRAECLR
ncbi:TPA: lysis protein [Proteus mirabilis]|uniref:lysis protein n=2 Tax=Proteus mirabilis TaxID=584 RepID=UPI000504DDC9|nr:lysis protein [Proteus mirabilis]KGA91303.1 bacteriophage Rz lysis family protein [Proteus mirabilis]UGO54375.1 putative lysis protein [Proteus phage vB_PmiP_Brookers]